MNDPVSISKGCSFSPGFRPSNCANGIRSLSAPQGVHVVCQLMQSSRGCRFTGALNIDARSQQQIESETEVVLSSGQVSQRGTALPGPGTRLEAWGVELRSCAAKSAKTSYFIRWIAWHSLGVGAHEGLAGPVGQNGICFKR